MRLIKEFVLAFGKWQMIRAAVSPDCFSVILPRVSSGIPARVSVEIQSASAGFYPEPSFRILRDFQLDILQKFLRRICQELVL